MIDNGHREGPRAGEPWPLDAEYPPLPEGVLAHLPAPPVALEIAGRKIHVRQVCACCGEVLVDELYDPLPQLVLPESQRPQWRSYPPGSWLAVYEIEGEGKATLFAGGVRPREACIWHSLVTHEPTSEETTG